MISIEEYENAILVIEKFKAQQEKLSKYKGKSTCPFCSGSKTKPFIRHGNSQNCKDCDMDGLISNRKLYILDLEWCITK